MQVNHVEVHLSDLDAAMKLLAKHHATKITELTPELKEAYQKVKYAVSTFHGGPSYAIIKQTIMKLVKPVIITPETLGSYIWGCVQDCYGDADKYCTPLCINSIPPETDEVPSCNHHVITREINDDGTVNISCLNCDKEHQRIHTAVLYSNDDIDALTGQEIRFLKNLGISQLAIMVRDGYKYWKKMEMTPIDRLASSAPETLIPKGFVQAPMHIKEEKHYYENNNYLSWFLIILLIVIIALMVYFFL